MIVKFNVCIAIQGEISNLCSSNRTQTTTSPIDRRRDTEHKHKRTVHFKTFLVPMPFPLVTTFETGGTYKKWLWPNSAHITYMWHALLLCYTFFYFHTHIYIFIHIYRTSSNWYTPDRVSLASLTRQLHYRKMCNCTV